MPQAYYGQPSKVYEGDGGYVKVQYPGKAYDRPLGQLGRQDLMRVAGAIAKSKGISSGGIKATNRELQKFVKKHTPWEATIPVPTPKKAKPAPTPPPGEDGKVLTTVKCECGHEYKYRINPKRLDSTKQWLETKPCPPCQRKDPQPQPKPSPMPNGKQKEAPQPEDKKEKKPKEAKPEDEAPKKMELGNLDLDKLADLLVGKVLERMSPIKMPPLHHEALPEVIKLLQAEVPVWLQGPPGTSKSTLAAQAAESLGLPLHAISCHEGMTRSDMFGYTDANGHDHRSPLWEAYENGGVLLLDEIDNGNANILAALNSALSNGHCTFAGKTINKHEKFMVVATANTAGLGPEAGFIGRMGVDLATLDRFVSLIINIDNTLEEKVVAAIIPAEATRIIKVVRKLRAAVEKRGLRMVVSPRTSFHSARMVRAGVSLEDAIKRTALKGLDDTTVNSLLGECF